jgi:hypothetical protein
VRVLWLWLLSAGLLSGCGRLGFGLLESSDAAPSDVIAAGGICPPFATFCDDFEAGPGNFDAWSGRNTDTGSVVIGSSHAHSGRFALEAVAPPATGSGGEDDLYHRFAVQSTGMLAARAWIYSPEPLVNYDEVIYFTNPQTSQYAEAGSNDEGHWSVSDFSTAGLFDHGSTAATPALDTWSCVELDYTFAAGAAGRVELYIDGALVVFSAAMDPSPAFGSVSVGVTRADKAGYRVFVDDVVIAGQHIGC